MNVPAVWAWLEAHSVPILSGIYLASMGCVLLLAICVFALARQHARLAGTFNAKLAAVERLVRSADERLEAVTLLIERATVESRAAASRREQEKLLAGETQTAQAPAIAGSGQTSPSVRSRVDATIRSEIQRLIAELDQAEELPASPRGFGSPKSDEPIKSSESADAEAVQSQAGDLLSAR